MQSKKDDSIIWHPSWSVAICLACSEAGGRRIELKVSSTRANIFGAATGTKTEHGHINSSGHKTALRNMPRDTIPGRARAPTLFERKCAAFQLILFRNLSFATADAPEIEVLAPGMPCSRMVSELVPYIGRLTMRELREMVAGGRFLSIQADSWTDALNRRFLAVLLSGLFGDKWKTFVLATRYVDEMHETAAVIERIITDVVEIYEIDPTYACSDTASNVKKSFVLLGEKERTLRISWWGCSLHGYNRVMNAFMAGIEGAIAAMKALRKRLCTSTFFGTFCEQKGSLRRVVQPVYEIRWTALEVTNTGFLELEPLIREFALTP
jgi:hypothetical protein